MTTTSNELGETSSGRDAVAGNLANVAEQAVSKLPEATQSGRAAVEEANRAIQSGSDEALMAGTTLSVGLALGLLLGGANRLLVILALIPAAAMGFTLLDRSQTGRTPVKRG